MAKTQIRTFVYWCETCHDVHARNYIGTEYQLLNTRVQSDVEQLLVAMGRVMTLGLQAKEGHSA